MARNEDVQQLSNGRWVVAKWVEQAAQYQAPMDDAGCRANPGASLSFAGTPDGLCSPYTYKRRSDALRRAREVYGEN